MPEPPRKKSKLTRTHPAVPHEDPNSQYNASSRASARASVREDAETGGHADERTPGPTDARPGGHADERTPAREDAAADEDLPELSTAASSSGSTMSVDMQWQMQKAARDAAWGWAAAAKKQARRTDSWTKAVARAAHGGVPPSILREQIIEAAYQAHVSPETVPVEVWRAAGIEPDR